MAEFASGAPLRLPKWAVRIAWAYVLLVAIAAGFGLVNWLYDLGYADGIRDRAGCETR